GSPRGGRGGGSAARAASTNARTLLGSLRPGADSTPEATSTPHGRTTRTASPTFSGVRPPARMMRRCAGAPSASDQSNTSPEPGVGESTRKASAAYSSAWSRRGSPAGNALMSSGTRWRIQWVSAGDSLPWSWTARSPAACATSTTRSRASSRNTPTVTISDGRRRAISAARCGAIWRGDGAKTKPTASAPMATTSRASSSDVTPHTLTNIERRLPIRSPGPGAGARPGRPQGGDGGRGVAGRDQRLADEHGVEPGVGQRGDAVGAPDARLGRPDHTRRHGPGHPDRPLVVDLERHEVALVDPDERRPDGERPLQLRLVVDLDQGV